MQSLPNGLSAEAIKRRDSPLYPQGSAKMKLGVRIALSREQKDSDMTWDVILGLLASAAMPATAAMFAFKSSKLPGSPSLNQSFTLARSLGSDATCLQMMMGIDSSPPP